MSDWRDDAECRNYPADWWHPETSKNTGKTGRAKWAIDICKKCPVREPCLRDALATDTITTGIWGGTTENDRRRMMGKAVAS